MRVTQHVEELPDPYTGDPLLGRSLDRLLGDLGHKQAAGALEDLSAACAGPLRRAALDAERHPPVLRAYDGWGRRVDEIETAAGWDVLRRAAAEHGLVALPYEDTARARWGAGARVVQHALLHLYAPDSAVFSCPVAMSDGAATVLSDEGVDPALADRLLPRLLSRDPDVAWTSGQWMTETEGGSDVGRAATRAVPDSDGWRLHGEKWFCSATTAEMAVALARPDGAPAGSSGLACFVVPRYAEDADPTVRAERGVTGLRATAAGLHIHRLKDKLGTRALPSAEVQLDGVRAWPVADPREPGGLRRMMSLVTVTRLHNAANAAALLRRGVTMARTYAETREVFGAPLRRQPLHREVLAGLTVEADAAFAITALCFDALGRVEVDADADSAALLRIANSLTKALTAKQAVAGLSEVVECFGGPGYVEDTGVPVLLRDAQVLPVWEGTTTIQALDVLRAASDPRLDAVGGYLRRLDAAISAAAEIAPLAATADHLSRARKELEDDVRAAAAAPGYPATQARARALSERLAVALAGAALLEQATFDSARGDARGAAVAELWIRRRVLGDACPGAAAELFDLVVDGRS